MDEKFYANTRSEPGINDHPKCANFYKYTTLYGLEIIACTSWMKKIEAQWG